jgi:hypothetical protein
MSDSPEKNQTTHTTCPPRVVADFGGRRKIFERRLRQIPIEHPDRRSGHDRRSGFDRRGTFEENIQHTPQRRKKLAGNSTGGDCLYEANLRVACSSRRETLKR